MEANKFVAEVYHRMGKRDIEDLNRLNKPVENIALLYRDWEYVKNDPEVNKAVYQYKNILPADKNTRILEVGYGNGRFLAACIVLGYKNIECADFASALESKLSTWSASIREIHDIKIDIADFLNDKIEKFDFIHLSHVIEHIPKYSLLYNVDSLYRSLKKGGSILIRTPNMESPRALSLYFCTLGHEYGFTVSNLNSLLKICNFDQIKFLKIENDRRYRGKLYVRLIKKILLFFNEIMHRLFGAESPVSKIYSDELVVQAYRLELPPLFNPETR
tara:strand:- start:757 stop:1581 length:825 start_codon:yes stop_codon:yes gene_type:complete